MRALGDLTSLDLGSQITAQQLPLAKGLPKLAAPVTGKLESVHHFMVAGVNYTAAIVRVIRTRKQVDAKEADCREIRGLSLQEVEVHEHA
jgi:hypothetical protein